MRLFLVRHGKAEDKTLGGDFYRKLTHEGQSELLNSFAKFKEIKEIVLEDTVVISSPLIRARETSKILVEALNLESFTVENFVANGDYTRLLEVIKEIDTNKTLIVVGHEPSLSYWIKNLTGEYVLVKKGSIHHLEFDKDLNSTKYYGCI